MINLLEETKDILFENGKSEKDVLWIGNEYIKFDWKHFEKISNFNYDNGYGGEEIFIDLLVVGKNFWLERHDYDGSEWWEYKELPKEPKIIYKIDTLRTRDKLDSNFTLKMENYKGRC